MSEPAEYIFQEWDAMCARANNSLRGSCPLLEDEVLVEMHKYLGGLEERLAAAEADAERHRWGIENARWLRHEHEAYLAIPVMVDADLSCKAMREIALDAAIDAARGDK